MQTDSSPDATPEPGLGESVADPETPGHGPGPNPSTPDRQGTPQRGPGPDDPGPDGEPERGPGPDPSPGPDSEPEPSPVPPPSS